MPYKQKFKSPFGVARYPHLSKPDTVGKFADNKYKTKLVLRADAPEAVAFMAEIDAAFKAAHPKPNKLCNYVPYTVDEETNEAVFTFKSTYAPAIFDGQRASMNGKNVIIGGGSKLRVMGSFVEFEKGISAQLNQVQVTDLQAFGECGFDEVEGGFSADDYEDSKPKPTASDDAADDDSLDI